MLKSINNIQIGNSCNTILSKCIHIYFYALFNRHIHTVNYGIYGRQQANVQGKDIALSLGIGRKINLFSDGSVQPKVQYTYHLYNQHPYTDSLQREFNRKDMRDREIRTGVKVQYKWIICQNQ